MSHYLGNDHRAWTEQEAETSHYQRQRDEADHYGAHDDTLVVAPDNLGSFLRDWAARNDGSLDDVLSILDHPARWSGEYHEYCCRVANERKAEEAACEAADRRLAAERKALRDRIKAANAAENLAGCRQIAASEEEAQRLHAEYLSWH